MNIRRFFTVSAILLFAIAASWANSDPSLGHYIARQFPDNSDLRARLFSRVIGAPRELAEAFGEHVMQSHNAGTVTVRIVPGDEDFYVEFLNGTGAPYTQGSCIIKRNNSMGYLVQAKIFLQDDPGCYLRLYTSGDGTRMDVIMYGAVLKRGLYVSGMLYQVLAGSFGDIVDQTSSSFDWNEVFGLGEREASTTFAASLRGALASTQAPGPDGGVIAPAASKSDTAAPAVALASAPLPGGAKDLAVGRAYRIALLVDKAAGAEALMSSLAAAGESAKELVPSDEALGFEDVRGNLDVSLPYGRFPAYEASKGLPLEALRAALYLDELSNPDSVYAVLGDDGLRLTVAPTRDTVGRLGFAFFSQGRELDWSLVAKRGDDERVRVLRIGAARS